MAYPAEQGAKNAEADTTNDPGYCQQQTRMWSGIPALYGDAATAWRNTNDRHPGDKNPPRGAHVFWTGGSSGYGHAAMSLGNRKIRSTDAGGRGVVATKDIDWFSANWGLTYGGWAWDNNEVTIPHDTPKPPEPPEDPDMNDFIQASSGTDKTIKADTWTPINWENVQAGDNFLTEGHQTIKIGGKRFIATLSVALDPTENDDSLRTRFVELESKDGDWSPGVVTETYPALESKTTGGSTYIVDTRVQFVPKERRLRAEVYLTSGGTLTSANLTILCFQP